MEKYEYLDREPIVGDAVEMIHDLSKCGQPIGKLSVVIEVYYDRIRIKDNRILEGSCYSSNYVKVIKTKPGSEAKVGDKCILIENSTPLFSGFTFDCTHIFDNISSTHIGYEAGRSIESKEVLVLCKAEEAKEAKETNEAESIDISHLDLKFMFDQKIAVELDSLEKMNAIQNHKDSNYKYVFSTDFWKRVFSPFDVYCIGLKSNNSSHSRRDYFIGENYEILTWDELLKRADTGEDKCKGHLSSLLEEKVDNILDDMQYLAEYKRVEHIPGCESCISEEGWEDINDELRDLSELIKKESFETIKNIIDKGGSFADDELNECIDEFLTKQSKTVVSVVSNESDSEYPKFVHYKSDINGKILIKLISEESYCYLAGSKYYDSSMIFPHEFVITEGSTECDFSIEPDENDEDWNAAKCKYESSKLVELTGNQELNYNSIFVSSPLKENEIVAYVLNSKKSNHSTLGSLHGSTNQPKENIMSTEKKITLEVNVKDLVAAVPVKEVKTPKIVCNVDGELIEFENGKALDKFIYKNRPDTIIRYDLNGEVVTAIPTKIVKVK